MTIAQLFVVGGLILTILYVFYQYQSYLYSRRRRSEVLAEQSVKRRASLSTNRAMQKGYNISLRIPILRTFLKTIRKKLETLAVYDEYTLRKEVMKIIYLIIAGFTIVALLLIIIRPSWLIIFWTFVGMLFVSGALVDFFVHRVEEKLLKQLKEYINRLRFIYQQTKMVEEATFEAIQYAGPEMKIHAEKINNIVNSLDPERELASYEEVAPTRYLRVLAGLILLVKERGDKITEEKSSFLEGLAAINKELNDEILHRSKLSYALRSLSVLSVIPIFMALPVKNWTISQFPTTEAFYASRLGFLAEILVYSISIICYLIIRKMREINDSSQELTVNKSKWEEKLIKRYKLIDLVTSAFSPTPYTKKHNELKQLIKDANEAVSVKGLTLQKIIIAIGVVVILIGSFTFSHYRERNSTLELSVSNSFFAAPFSEAAKEIERQKTEYDRQIIDDLSKLTILPTEDELKEMIRIQQGLPENSAEIDNAFNRIVYKWDIITNSYLKWWEVILSLLLGFTAMQLPVLILQFKRKVRLKMMEREVYQLLVLIGILRDFEGMSVSTILLWLQRFSIAFKQSLTRAIEEFDSGPEHALERLSENNTFEPFQQVVERLKLTLIRLSIKESFSDIGIEREYYLEQRKEEQRRSLETKQRTGDMLGLAPIVSLIFIYMIFPIMYIAVKESAVMIQLLG